MSILRKVAEYHPAMISSAKTVFPQLLPFYSFLLANPQVNVLAYAGKIPVSSGQSQLLSPEGFQTREENLSLVSYLRRNQKHPDREIPQIYLTGLESDLTGHFHLVFFLRQS